MKRKYVLLMSVFLLLVPTQASETMKQRCWQTSDLVTYQVSGGPDVDVFTQRGGKGYGEPSPPFCPAEEIILCANATYNEYPEQAKYIAFQIFYPNEESLILSAITNETGIAITRFRLSSSECPEEILGIWRLLATVNIAGVVANDTLEFHVCRNPADVDHDLDVDLYDAVRVLVAYGSKLGDEHYSCYCDIAEPYGVIDLYDAALVLVNYGGKYS
jgi:hypothetical protein